MTIIIVIPRGKDNEGIHIIPRGNDNDNYIIIYFNEMTGFSLTIWTDLQVSAIANY